ncbi:hypothetical protein [Planobispora rosea]|uniref:hypothetical protein n=1 Tax=Planobispora rosea TaxID=35762 RepID=UPI00083B0EFD|nr:hypothetical protein [Planobispora rosea]
MKTTTTAPQTGTQRTANLCLAALLREAGYSNKSFARALRQTSQRVGWPLVCGHESVARWLKGVPPRAETADLIVITLSQALGRRITGKDAGLHAPGILADVPAGQRAVSVAVERDLEVMRRRLEWLTNEAAQLAHALTAIQTGQTAPEPTPTPTNTTPGTLYRRAAHRQAAHTAHRAARQVTR